MDTDITCKLCGADNISTIYDGPIRSEGAESGFEGRFLVKECLVCGIAFLSPFPGEMREYYGTEKYWVAHHGQINIQKLYKKLGPEQLRWLYEIGIEHLRNKRVADFGCGAGIFLDLISRVATETIGIEPANFLQPHLEANGHRYLERAKNLEPASIDVAVSFDTLEHVETPKQFLETIYAAIKPGGMLFLGVPNQNDFLKQIIPTYLSFFYHKSHLFYFNANTTVTLLENVGFQECKVRFVHKYDLMNLIVWARDGRGQGKQGSDLFDFLTEESFRLNLERQGIASHILVEARK